MGPYIIVKSKEFKDLLLRYQAPDRKTFSDTIVPQVYGELKAGLIQAEIVTNIKALFYISSSQF